MKTKPNPVLMQVWVMIMAMTLVMGPVLAAVGWVQQRSIGSSDLATLSLDAISFTAFRSLVVQGNLLFPKHIPMRVIFFTWYLFCFVIYGESGADARTRLERHRRVKLKNNTRMSM